MIDNELNAAIREISEKVMKEFGMFGPMEQERILGLMQGMAIMRELQEKNGPAS